MGNIVGEEMSLKLLQKMGNRKQQEEAFQFLRQKEKGSDQHSTETTKVVPVDSQGHRIAGRS